MPEFEKDTSYTYMDAEKIILVMDNYCTQKSCSLFEAFDPKEVKKIMEKFKFVYTPKHGSWLNMA